MKSQSVWAAEGKPPRRRRKKKDRRRGAGPGRGRGREGRQGQAEMVERGTRVCCRRRNAGKCGAVWAPRRPGLLWSRAHGARGKRPPAPDPPESRPDSRPWGLATCGWKTGSSGKAPKALVSILATAGVLTCTSSKTTGQHDQSLKCHSRSSRRGAGVNEPD